MHKPACGHAQSHTQSRSVTPGHVPSHTPYHGMSSPWPVSAELPCWKDHYPSPQEAVIQLGTSWLVSRHVLGLGGMFVSAGTSKRCHCGAARPLRHPPAATLRAGLDAQSRRGHGRNGCLFNLSFMDRVDMVWRPLASECDPCTLHSRWACASAVCGVLMAARHLWSVEEHFVCSSSHNWSRRNGWR